MFPMMPSFKIAQMVPLHQTEGPPELQIKLLMTSEPLAQIQNNFTELFLITPSTKIAQMVSAPQNKRAARALDKKYL